MTLTLILSFFIKTGVNEDESLPYKFFIFFPPLGRIKEGDLVAFRPIQNDPFMKNLDGLIVKKVGCSYPHELVVKGKEYYCKINGNLVYLGKALERSRDGRKVKNFTWSGQVPKGCYFVVGTHKRSYDSRYFGFVCKVEYKAVGF